MDKLEYLQQTNFGKFDKENLDYILHYVPYKDADEAVKEIELFYGKYLLKPNF
jgi:hypothetical protein